MFIPIIALLLLMLLSGWGDSQGFVHASNIWKNDKFHAPQLILSALGFGLGATSYWIALRFITQIGILSAELQTLGWFGAVIIGVALASGKFFSWSSVDQTVGILVIAGIGFLLMRIG